jgi:dolichyl-phosphate-mannose--protein O-mannosyl transferase
MGSESAAGVVERVKPPAVSEPVVLASRPAGHPLRPEIAHKLVTIGSDPASWLATWLVVLVATVLRLANLRHPDAKIFDETYYATEADGLIKHWVEWDAENAQGRFVVHPPLGKWCIALGELAFGNNSFGWRISAVVAGIVSVLLIVRIGRRLFRSTVLGCAAGLLLTLDGLHFVLSRSAMLDIFLMLFVLAAFGCVLLDRDQRRARALAALTAGEPIPGGAPYWRLAAALCMGCATGVKLSALFFLPALLAIVLMWEIGLRRAVGDRRPWAHSLRGVLGWSVVAAVIVVAVYLASWTGWFLTDTGWGRHSLASRGESEPPVLGALYNLWEYHQAAYGFHRGLSSKHDYQSWPWQWLLMGRPVLFYSDTSQPCGADQCVAQVLLLGTPLLWWSFLPALAGLAWFGIAARDRRAAALGLMVGAGLLPWFWYHFDGGRTMYVFYALPAEPFLILALLYVLGRVMGPPGGRWRVVGALVLGGYVLVIAANFAYLHPLLVGDSIPLDAWWDRLWLGRRWV